MYCTVPLYARTSACSNVPYRTAVPPYPVPAPHVPYRTVSAYARTMSPCTCSNVPYGTVLLCHRTLCLLPMHRTVPYSTVPLRQRLFMRPDRTWMTERSVHWGITASNSDLSLRTLYAAQLPKTVQSWEASIPLKICLIWAAYPVRYREAVDVRAANHALMLLSR